MANDLVGVCFEERHRKWNGGERAGFTAQYAKELVDAGLAKYTDEDDAAEKLAAAEKAQAEEDAKPGDENEATADQKTDKPKRSRRGR